IKKWHSHAASLQQATFRYLVKEARNTAFGKDHCFEAIQTYQDFRDRVPVRDYEALRPYIDRMVAGEADVLWKNKPRYLAKTSGTTSRVKYIPISGDSMPHHIRAARNALLMYIHETGKADFVAGEMILPPGSSGPSAKNRIDLGPRSRRVAPDLPRAQQPHRAPPYAGDSVHA